MTVRHITLFEALALKARMNPDALGWVFDNERVTFSQMHQRSSRVAQALLGLGLRKGDTIALWMPNLPEFAYIQFAAARIGLVATAINTRSKTAEVSHILGQGNVKAVFMVETFLKHNFLDALRRIIAEAKGQSRERGKAFVDLSHVIIVGQMKGDFGASWGEFLGRGADVREQDLLEAEKQVVSTEPLLLQYTSGTTAKPKGALLNHVYVLNYGVEYVLRMGVRPGESYMNTQPFYHVGGSCAALPVPLSTGVVMVSATYYTPEKILELIERERCVGRSGYSAMYIMEMGHPDFHKRDLSSLRAGWCVGSVPVLEKIKREYRLHDLFQVYGSTESNGTCGFSGHPWELQSRSCGKPLTETELRIVDTESRKPLSPGQVGEIQMRGWCTMNGYYNMPEATRAVLDDGGWLSSGDLGFVDVNNFLYFVGRAKDMLKVGGENVSAQEVEVILHGHPDIVQASVIGAPDDRLGEVVMAVVETTNDDLTEEDVVNYCTPRLANFRVPRYVRFTKEWPMTALGKIQKNVLRDRYSRDV